MSHPWVNFEVAYITIELESAFLVEAGDNDRLADAVFVTDANGLPCIPGESLAGVLRHALAGDDCPEKNLRCREVFGFQEKSCGQASRVRLSYGHVHGQDDRPVPFRGAKLAGDTVLSALQAGVVRDHVRIGKHGAAEDKAKFDELLIPAGARFTFEITLSKEAQSSAAEFVSLLSRPEVRIGGKTRRGMGQFRVVKAVHTEFDLTKKDDLKRLGALPVALELAAVNKSLKTLEVSKVGTRSSYLNGTVLLRPTGTWMIGGGSATGRASESKVKKEGSGEQDAPLDRLPLSEKRIRWKQSGPILGTVESGRETPYLLPASSVKGAVRHRTAFHARRLNGDWYDPSKTYGESDKVEDLLFGNIRGGDKGKPGVVYLSDVYLPADTKVQLLQHVSLDRFTQGPMDHMLYDELALCGGEIAINISVDESQIQDDRAKEALAAAIEDLCQGRLALGAGRGHGRFTGQVTWENNKTLVSKVGAVC